jgi:hypothetical protein
MTEEKNDLTKTEKDNLEIKDEEREEEESDNYDNFDIMFYQNELLNE